MKRSVLQFGRGSRWLAVAAVLIMMIVGSVRKAAGGTIFVTTTEQKISSTGGCSLQEAVRRGRRWSQIMMRPLSFLHFARLPFRGSRTEAMRSGRRTVRP